MRRLFQKDDTSWRLRHLLRAGDAVTVLDNDESWRDRSYSLGRNHPTGATGVVVGFSVKSIGRFAYWWSTLKPGMYIDNEWVFVRIGESEVRHLRARHLQLQQDVLDIRLAEHRILQPDYSFVPGPFLRDLPETMFWEGDLVRLKDWKNIKEPGFAPGSFQRHPDAYTVGSISWIRNRGDITETFDAYPKYTLEDRFYLKSASAYMDFQMELVERGNVWRLAHGEQPIFEDLAEEAIFHLLTRRTKIIKRTFGGHEVARNVLEGQSRGHGLRYWYEFEGWSSDYGFEVIEFQDEDLAARLRKATLEEGFLIPSKDGNPPDSAAHTEQS